MNLLRLEDVFFGGTEEERQEAESALNKINLLRVRAQERRQEAHRRQSLTESFQKLQVEESLLDKALSEVEELRRTNEDQRSKLFIEAEQLLKRSQALIEKKALVSQARARLIDEAGRKDCHISSASEEEVKAMSPPDSPPKKGHPSHPGLVTVPKRTASLKEAVGPTSTQATSQPPLQEARRPQTASAVSLSRAGSRTRPATSSSTTRTVSGLWRRSSVAHPSDSVQGDASHDTSFGSSIASRGSSLRSLFAPFSRSKELDLSASVATPRKDIHSFYVQQGLAAKEQRKTKQTQAVGQEPESEEGYEEIANDITRGPQDESHAQGRIAMAYV
ncbi:hypothetical protein BCV69DRAFT_283072, partial [Microstroma glucosiphilum]